MIAFKITFLLSFNSNLPSKLVKEKKTKANTKSNTPRGRKGQPSEIDDKPKKDYQVELGDFLNSVRVEYELLPGKFKYNLDIICWKNIAKVSCSDGYRFYRTMKCKDIVWVPCTIHHFFSKLSEDELLNLYSHVIRFNVSYAKKENLPKVPSLFCLEADVALEKFVECYEEDPNESSFVDDDGNQLNQAQEVCLSTDVTTSWIKFIGVSHCRMVYRIMKSFEKGGSFKYSEYNSSLDLPIIEKNPPKKGKKQDDKKKEPYFVVPAEVFFTDSNAVTYKLKQGDTSVTDGFVFLSVQNLLTDEQKVSLNPFIVKIEALQHLPAALLKKHGYHKVYITYEIPDIVQYESLPKTVEQNVYFGDYHAYFLRNSPTVRFLEFIRSQRLKVEIKGVREDIQKIEPALFGTKDTDLNFSKRLHPREAAEILNDYADIPKNILLAVANYDLSSLLKNTPTVKEEALCHYPDNLIDGKQELLLSRCMDVTTMAEVNLEILNIKKSISPLKEHLLTSACTNLWMEFGFLVPQNVLYHQALSKSKTFKRMFLIVRNRLICQDILASILLHNESIIGLDAVIINPVHFVEDRVKLSETKKQTSKRRKQNALNSPDEQKPKLLSVDDIITGFAIDNGYEMLIYAEGISHGLILEVWNKVHKLNPSEAKVFMNSKNDFEGRLYNDPSNLGSGIMRITLKKPLQEILKDKSAFIEGAMPLPCFMALQKLNLLLQTETLDKMVRLNLFPNPRELLGILLEFGVPLRLAH